MTIPKELKEAISHLSSAEKDKLIFRLLKKDLVLANRLLFELVSEESVEEKRQKTQEKIEKIIERRAKHFYSCGVLNMEVRELSGIINEHVSITKDKFGEISLNLSMICKILETHKKDILEQNLKKAQKFCTAVIARAFKLLILIKKMHEDYFMEFQEDLQKFGELIADNPYLIKSAIHNGLDVRWLISGEIPDDISKIHREIRDKGLL
ncbi:hypothetical protein CKY20_04465 [Capnocytophaga canis]|uniref:Uncharacterized protein n=1 Tax=Capnocytophaga canis TaxID=1848903 RepID=A0A3A1YIA7_9FLAO|nr:hypothetical protein [Capnocytophaga canis]RIY37341.1 hypothetical protein CKY20_04465 [Capnocytophaga canis]